MFNLSCQSLSCVQLFANPCTAACQASLSITNSWSLLRLMSIKPVMPSNHLILCCPLLFLPLLFPSVRVFPISQFFTSCGQSIEASASASVLPMNIQGWPTLGLTYFRIVWFDFLAVQGTLKHHLQHHNLKASILWHSPFFMVQLTSIHDHWKNHSFD